MLFQRVWFSQIHRHVDVVPACLVRCDESYPIPQWLTTASAANTDLTTWSRLPGIWRVSLWTTSWTHHWTRLGPCHQWGPAAGCGTHISGGSATGARGHQRPGHDSLERNVLVALFIDGAEDQQKPPQPEIIRGRYCRFVYKSPHTNANKSTTKIYTIRTQ